MSARAEDLLGLVSGLDPHLHRLKKECVIWVYVFTKGKKEVVMAMGTAIRFGKKWMDCPEKASAHEKAI